MLVLFLWIYFTYTSILGFTVFSLTPFYGWSYTTKFAFCNKRLVMLWIWLDVVLLSAKVIILGFSWWKVLEYYSSYTLYSRSTPSWSYIEIDETILKKSSKETCRHCCVLPKFILLIGELDVDFPWCGPLLKESCSQLYESTHFEICTV